MRLWTLLLMAAIIGQAQTASKPAASKSESNPAKTTVVKLPVKAVRVADGLYRFADPDGKVWLYRRTPFGYAKSEEGALQDAATAGVRTDEPGGSPFSGAARAEEGKPAMTKSAAAVTVTATEEGENIRFERPTPFGKAQWVKRKSELNAEETKIWESQRNKAAEPDSK